MSGDWAGLGYDRRLAAAELAVPGAGEAVLTALTTEPGRRLDGARRMLPGGGGSRLRSASARAIGSSSSIADGVGGPCREGILGSGMVIVGGVGGRPMSFRPRLAPAASFEAG